MQTDLPNTTYIQHWNEGCSRPLIIPVQVVCNTSNEEIHANIYANSRLDKEWIHEVPKHDGVAVICGSGPSLADTMPEILELVARGGKVFALNGAAKFLAERGITADYQVIIDARERTADLIGPAHQHLFASQVHPECFARVPSAKLWHLQVGDIEKQFPFYEGPYALIGGAASVGNTATCLAYVLGFRDLHCFGYDSSHRGTDSHAFRQPMNDGEPCTEVEFDGTRYRASVTMKLQAEKFQETARALQNAGCTISVHGNGLLPAMWRSPRRTMSEAEKYVRMWNIGLYRELSPGENCVYTFIDLLHPDKVIDFGCGTGRAAVAMQKDGIDVTLVDFAPNCRDEAARELPFLQHDLSDPLPIKAPYGFCTDVMEHIPTKDVETVLRNITDAADTVFFQISTVPDLMGVVIGQDLHLTVRPHAWWHETLQKLGDVTFERDHGIWSIFVVTNAERCTA